MPRSFVSPGQYTQESGILPKIGPRIDRLGSHAFLLADETVRSIVSEPIEQSLSETSCRLTVAQFTGECTAAEIDRLTARARDAGADVILGAGGGKAIDTAKAVRSAVGGAMVSIPTIASTDAPTSGVSVLYTDDGRFDAARVHDRRPELVFVDTAIIAAAPTRLFVSGIGDALATEYEALAAATGGGETVAGNPPTRAGTALAERCGAIIRDQGRKAVAAVERDEVTPAVEDVIEAIILLSGLGFENGGLAAAHAIHDGLSMVVQHDVLHGEKVSIGLLAQLLLEERPDEEIQSVVSFATAVGLPTTLADIQLDPADDQQLATVARTACDERSSMANQPGTVTPAAVIDALRSLESYSGSR